MGRYAYVTQAPLPDQRRTSSRKRGIHGSSQVIPALARSQLARTAQLGQPDARAHRRLGQPVQRPIAAMTQPWAPSCVTQPGFVTMLMYYA